MPAPRVRYPEKALQFAAIKWLKDHRNYREEYSDVEARGARVDSVGVFEGRLTLIEVKVSLGAEIVEHALDGAHSLEAKVAGALGPIYRREKNPVASAAHRIWDRRSAPLLCVLARSFSPDGLSALTAMLNRRSKDGHFDFTIWRWRDEVVESLVSCIGLTEPPITFDAVEVPQLVGRTPREKPRSFSELQAIADEGGVGNLFRQVVQVAPEYGFKIHRNRWGVMLKREVNGHVGQQSVIGVYLQDTPEIGLNVGCWRELIGVDADTLPGSPAAKEPGFLNTNRLLTTTDETRALFANVRRLTPGMKEQSEGGLADGLVPPSHTISADASLARY